jgi:hypothetical protein
MRHVSFIKSTQLAVGSCTTRDSINVLWLQVSCNQLGYKLAAIFFSACETTLPTPANGIFAFIKRCEDHKFPFGRNQGYAHVLSAV